MNTRRNRIAYGALAAVSIAVTIGMLAHNQHHISQPRNALWPKLAATYRFTELSGTDDQEAHDISLAQWHSQPLLVLFWRSDCAPCLLELRDLSHIAAQHKALPIALISLHDLNHTRSHLPALPHNTHALLANDDAGALLTAFGNDRTLALPYSAMLDTKGNLCQNHNGILTPDLVNDWVKQCANH